MNETSLLQPLASGQNLTCFKPPLGLFLLHSHALARSPHLAMKPQGRAGCSKTRQRVLCRSQQSLATVYTQTWPGHTFTLCKVHLRSLFQSKGNHLVTASLTYSGWLLRYVFLGFGETGKSSGICLQQYSGHAR